MTMPPQNQVFYITSSAPPSAPGKPYVLGVQGDNVDNGSPVIVEPAEFTDAQGQLWTMDSDGHILSQLGKCALTWDSPTNQLVVAELGDSGYPLQLWAATPDGFIKSTSMDDLVLTLVIDNGQRAAVLDPQLGGVPQRWILQAPASPPGNATRPKWAFFQSGLQDDTENACLLNVQWDQTTSGANVIVWPLGDAVATNELWQVTPDGRILSDQGNNLVLTMGPVAPGGGNSVTVETQQNPLPLTQVWDFSTPNQIRNAFSGEYLVPSGATQGPITLSDGDFVLAAGVPEEGTTTSYTWYTAPSSSLKEVMAQPQTPFQEFTDGQADAYKDLLTMLQITSLRAEYYNLDTTLSDYGSQIASWTEAPNGVKQADWDAVRDQLLLEIRYANTTRNLFENYRAFHLALFVDNGALLNEAIADAGLTQGENAPNVSGFMLSLFEGLAYTGLCAAPGVGPVLGNLMEAGISIALAAGSGAGSISPDPFQVAVSELWEQLSDNFDALLISMGNMEITILQDWGKLQSVYQLTRPQQNGCDSLYWNPNTTAQLVNAARTGYMISVMQMLLPVKYQIYTTQDTDFFPDDCPDSAKWQSGGTNYWIATNDNAGEYPAEWTMQKDIWGNGVRQANFFLSAAGWAFARSDDNDGLSKDSTFTFTNLTPNLLELASSEAQIDVQIPPYQSFGVDLNMDQHEATTFNFQVTDLNNPQGDIPQFTVQVSAPAFHGTQISITTPSGVSGYQFTPAIGNTNVAGLGGGGPEGFTAAGSVGLIQA
ncbi:hypothetical protein [Streptosporangium sp. KLBMP 9127]|nr:hypothetical protein [Streptosporangium sp. KLBMP 9127]